MSAYYNEIDPFAAAWLRNLIAAGHIAPGDVDERSIKDVHSDDLRGYTQCHFFAGIGVWSYALRRAGWPDDQHVWTGSCPCQPFSAAGRQSGFDDERHLWPVWYRLIRECRPAVVFGEQVASSAVDLWIDLVQADVESLGHAFGCVPFPSAGVNAPNIRDRAYWLAYAHNTRPQGRRGMRERAAERAAWPGGVAGGMADADGSTRGQGRALDGGRHPGSDALARPGPSRDGDAHGGLPGSTDSFWRAADWLLCRDGKWRPVEPGTFPLVDGAPARVGRLRAYGNAINAEAARAFIEASRDALLDLELL
ncbi:DNA cytosine methyltransferase [Burkholderia glumae]|uniref:DNA cytosine methyltransferase n=1 Tax=Burkholderia glumae TaxID=337 RepID=UPI002151DAA1|nr:DNA cytosine methyltransferase [Burkholderia glumae]